MRDAASMTDGELVASVLSGNREHFEILVERYQQPIYALSYRYASNAADAQDLAQETFLTAYARLSSFEGRSQFSTWLYRVCVNLCIDFLRRRKRTSGVDADEEFISRLPDTSAGPEQSLILTDEQRVMRNAIDALPQRYKTVLLLYYFQEQSYEQIARILQIPLRTVETRLYRARHKLRAQFPQGGAID